MLPRHEIAQDSELLQAQLLQPINADPVQPRLADDGLAFLDDTFPSDTDFNEFTRVFASDGVQLFSEGVVGNYDTYADNVILTGTAETVSFSLGQAHFETDGIRDNNDLNEEFGNAFFQVHLLPNTMIQAEYRYNEEKAGDRNLLFDSDEIRFDVSADQEIDTLRLGARHEFSPNSMLLGSFISREQDTRFQNSVVLDDTDQDSFFFELRYLLDQRGYNLTVGGGYIQTDFDNTIELLQLPFPPFLTSIDQEHTNGYIYLNILVHELIDETFPIPMESLALTLGISEEEFESGMNDNNQTNPKVGIVWSPFKNTTIRGAAFRTLKRTLISSQTIEPTQVAGFNQFFDDFNFTRA